MVQIIWGSFLIIGIGYSFITGNAEAINNEIIACGNTALELILDMVPLLVIWMGLMRIAEQSGLIEKIAKLMTPLLSHLFPKVPKNHPALGYVASNVVINMAGLGSAATPAGLKAMSKFQELNENKSRATSSMITFLILNTGGVTIIPTAILALRLSYGSTNPTAIVPLTILATLAAGISGLTLDYFIRRKNGNR